MRKYMYLCLCLFVLCIIFLSNSCENERGESNINNIFFENFVMDDVKPLENLTKEYDINELSVFFKDSKVNESIGFGSTTPPLVFSEVNARYPVEILRTGGYSVYKVSQGGFFYVFWIKPFTNNFNQLNNEPIVYFTAHISSNMSLNMFDLLKSGVSTAEDVKSIDPNFELSFLLSYGIFSYSIIDSERILQIEYTHQKEFDGYDDLIVKEMVIIPRKSAPSRYSSLLPDDIL